MNKNDCHKKHIKNVLDNASAAPYKHSTTWLVALQAMSADQPAEADTDYASMLYKIYALSNKCTCKYGTFTGKKQSEYTGE